MKIFLLFCISSVLYTHAVHAQLHNDGEITNDGSLVSDWQNQWFNTANGVYTGSNNGIFEHHGPSSQTFLNNGTYNALTGHADQFLGPLGVAGGQEIGGSVRPFFFNLLLNNGATDNITISNTDGANVRGTATFSNGITSTIRNIHQVGALRFEDNATYSGGNSDAQHVNGYISKIGDDSFIFPVGSGTDLRTLTINAPAVSNEISVAWFSGDPSSITDPSDGSTHSTSSVAGPILSVSNAGFWDWIPVAGSDDGLTITVSTPDLSAFAVATNLRLVGWNGTQWIDLSGAATASGNSENSTLSGTIPVGSAITAISIGSVSFILPVQFVSFTVTTNDCHPVVRWSTATEDNNDHFEVQRSHDGSGFVVIASLQGAGNSTTLQQYEYIDLNPIPGNNFYRIRQVDRDGNSSYTQIKSILIDCGSQTIKVYPTVSRTTVTVQLPEAYKNARLSLVDITGRQINVAIQGNNRQRTVYLNDLPAAQYFLLIINDSETQTFKILKP
jgi:hypothetical protein